ncbi:PSY4 (YBL046W) [Zygosaccharomyces parabailii]|nr:PSY4 (YBL046W) [Zygosaccharomyces parabailii]CDH11491.1 uncharacterized protein ZBAI_03277 [Zygosaccharomyces bailii ISA1307]
MPTSIRQGTAVSTADHNMTGTQPKTLPELLERVAEKQDLKALEITDAREVATDLIRYITVDIPEHIFKMAGDTQESLKNRLLKLGQYLEQNFLTQGKYPFTMRRICELCYDPLKYYKVHELEKFVSAMRVCCMVSTAWDHYTKEESDASRRETNLNGLDHEDVSLTKIPWMDEKSEKSLLPFIAEIDGIMSVNFGYDEDDEDADDDVGFGTSNRREEHFDMEEYGGSILDCDADDDEEDEDYVEGLMLEGEEDGDDDEGRDEDEDDDDDDEDEDESEEAEGEEAESEGKEDKEGDYAQQERSSRQPNNEDELVRHGEKYPRKRTPSKRKTTELDNYDYEEGIQHECTPPKKLRQGLQQRDVIESPQLSRLPRQGDDTPGSSQEVVSPEDDGAVVAPGGSRENKMRSIIDSTTYEHDMNSPLSNKTRLS